MATQLHMDYNKFIHVYDGKSRQLPDFLQAVHCATLLVAVSSTAAVEESASQTGVVENASHPSATPPTRPHMLHTPEERHL